MRIFTETERLICREITLDDAEGMFEMDADPEVHKYLGNKPTLTREQNIEMIRNFGQQYIDNGIARWALIEKSTNSFIGWGGLKLMRTSVNNHIDYYDMGYRLMKRYWGRGYATESAMASIDYAFNEMELPLIYASAHVDNTGSNKILQKVGMQFIETFYYDGDILCNWYSMENGAILRNTKDLK